MSDVTSTADTRKRRFGWRRWLRFSTRSLLLLTTAIAVWLGYELNHLRHRDAAIRRLQAAGMNPVLGDVPRTPRAYLARIAGLNSGSITPFFSLMAQPLSDEMCRDLAALNDAHFSTVMLIGAGVTDEKLAALAPACDPETLWLIDNSLGDPAMATIARWQRLAVLRLGKDSVTDVGLAQLGQLPRLVSLEITDRGLAEGETPRSVLTGQGFAQWPATSPLKTLNLDNTQIDDRGAAAIGRFAKIETLRLGRTLVTDAGLAQLAGLTRLASLNLDKTKVSGTGFAKLAGCGRLAELSLHNTPVDDEGLRAIAKLSALRTLWLSHTQITDNGARRLAELKALEVLDVAGCELTDAALEEFSKLDNLFVLNLRGCSITDASLAKLARLKKLERLTVSKTQVTPQGVARLKAALPMMEVDD